MKKLILILTIFIFSNNFNRNISRYIKNLILDTFSPSPYSNIPTIKNSYNYILHNTLPNKYVKVILINKSIQIRNGYSWLENKNLDRKVILNIDCEDDTIPMKIGLSISLENSKDLFNTDLLEIIRNSLNDVSKFKQFYNSEKIISEGKDVYFYNLNFSNISYFYANKYYIYLSFNASPNQNDDTKYNFEDLVNNIIYNKIEKSRAELKK